MRQDSKHSSDQCAAYGNDSQEAFIRYNYPNHAKQLSMTVESSVPSTQQRPPSMLFDFLRKKKAEQDVQGRESDVGSGDENDKYRGNKVRHTIDPTDGKTMACNRGRTFDSFVDEQKLGEAEQQKKTGHGWEVLRALSKLKALFKKSPSKASSRAGKQHNSGVISPRLLC